MPVCNNCGSREVTEGGLQWFPLTIIEAQFDDPPILDESRPELGALRLYTCTHCHTTFLEPPAAKPVHK